MVIRTVIGDTLPEAYEMALSELQLFGEIKKSEDWGTLCKELTMTMVVNKPLDEPMISVLSLATPESLQKYLMEMLDGLLDWSIGVKTKTGVLEPYTYHERIWRQWDGAIDELKRSKSSRRACITVRTQEDVGSCDPACLQHIQFFVNDNKLDMHVMFRSNDACRATFMNAFALIMLQKKALEELREAYPELQIGCYVHHANSFHAYAERDGRFALLTRYVNRIRKSNSDEIRTDYADGWQDMMEEYVGKIVAENEDKKNQYGFL